MPFTMGTTYTREQSLFPSLARTTHAASNEINVNGAEALRVDVDITAFTGTSITFTVQGYDTGSATWVTLLASAALSATGHTVLMVGISVPTTANISAAVLPPKRVRVLPSGTITSVTYSVGAVWF